MKPGEAIHEGAKINVLPLQGIEQFSLDGVTYEAFNTSGGLGTLASATQVTGEIEIPRFKWVGWD